MKDRMRRHFSFWPGVEFEFQTTDMAADLGNSGKLILKIQGDSEEEMRDVETEMLELLGNRPEILALDSDRKKLVLNFQLFCSGTELFNWESVLNRLSLKLEQQSME